jgi:hypothetical protein
MKGGKNLLVITDITTDTSLPLVDFNPPKRTRGVKNNHQLELTVKATERNKEAFKLIKYESVITLAGNKYVIKNIARKMADNEVVEVDILGVHEFFTRTVDNYQYDVIEGERVLSVHQALTHALEGTGYSFTVRDEFDGYSFENFGDDFSSVLFNTAQDNFRFEVEITDDLIEVYKQVGKDTDEQVRWKHNIKTLRAEENSTNFATYIRGTGRTKEDENGIVIEGEFEAEAEYTSPMAEVFGIRHAKPVEDRRYRNDTALRNHLENILVDYPQTEYQVEYVELNKNGLNKQLDIGDRMILIHEPMELAFATRIVEVVDYPLNPNIKPIYTISSKKEGAVNKAVADKKENKRIQDELKVVNGKFTEFDRTMETTKEAMAELEHDMQHVDEEMERLELEVIPEVERAVEEVKIPRQPNPPEEIPVSNLWWDTSLNPPELKRWTGEEWVKLAPTEESINDLMEQMRDEAIADGIEYTDEEVNAVRQALEAELSNQIGDVNKSIGDLESVADGLKSRVVDTEELLGEHGGKFNQFEADIDEIEGTLSANITSIERIDDTVSGHSTELTAQAGKIEAKLDSVEYQTDKTDILSSIQSNSSEIDANSEAIGLRVTQEEFENLEVGGRNYFTRSKVNNLAWVSSGLSESSEYRGYSFKVEPGQKWTLYRTSTVNNRWGVWWLDHEPADGSDALTRAFREDNQEANTVRRLTVPEGATWGFIYLSNQADDIPDIMLEKGNRATDYRISPEDLDNNIEASGYRTKPLSVRYIRDWTDGSSANSNNHWVQIKAMRNGENLAEGATVTSNGEISDGERVVDGNTSSSSSSYARVTDASPAYVQVDLGQIYLNIEFIQVWHYYSDNRIYNNTKTEVSEDGVTWIVIFDSAVSGTYSELEEGRAYIVNDGYGIASSNSRISQTEATLNIHAGQIAAKAESSELENYVDKQVYSNDLGEWTVGTGSIRGRVESTEAEIDNISGEYDDFYQEYSEFKLESDTFMTRVGTLSDDGDTLVEQVSSIEQTANSISSTIQNIETGTGEDFEDYLIATHSRIEQLDDEINLAVGEGIADMEIGGRNLIGHHNIIAGGWVDSNGEVSISSYNRVASEFIEVQNGTRFLTFNYDEEDYPGSSVKYALALYDENHDFIERLTSRDTSSPRIFNLTSNTRYVRLSYPTETREYDNYAKLEKGNKATDWTPAPEDQVNKTNVLSSINLSTEGVKIEGAKIDIAGLVTVLNADGSAGTMIDGDKLVNRSITTTQLNVDQIFGNSAVISKIQSDSISSASIHANQINAGTINANRIGSQTISSSKLASNAVISRTIASNAVTANKISVTSLSAINANLGIVTTGRLLSGNNNMDLNLNTGNLTMRNANFTLGGGADIGFTSAGNRLFYERHDSSSGITRTSGIGVGNAFNSRFPVVWMGTTGTSRLNFDPTDENYFTGFIANTSQRQASDGIQNSVVGHKFHIRDQAVFYNKGFEFDLNGSTIVMRGMSTGSYDYQLGYSSAPLARVITNHIQVDSSFTIRNRLSINQGWRMNTAPDGSGDATSLYGLNSGSYNYQIGSRRVPAYIDYIYLRNDPRYPSDEKLKENIGDLNLGLDFIKELKPREFSFKLTEADVNQGKTENDMQFGLIAQETLQTLNKFNVEVNKYSIIDQRNDGIYDLQYGQLIIPTIKAVQELDNKVDDEISQLTQENEELRGEITLLKMRLKHLEESA